MAFQMIPPRVSSSPPPLDSLPSVACTGDDDEDEEFGSFSTHNTFDITGLSDKLPPTPESSPSKFPNQAASGGGSLKAAHEGVQSAKNEENIKYGGESHEVEWSPFPSARDRIVSDTPNSVRVPDINGDVSGSLEAGDDDEDFGDFSQYSCGDSTVGQVNDDSITTGGINSSQCPNKVSEISDSANNSFSCIATPPPLDHIADSIVVDDEFSRISPNPPPIQDDEFGDFASFGFETATTSCSVFENDTEGDIKVNEIDKNDDCVKTDEYSADHNISKDENTAISGVLQEPCQDVHESSNTENPSEESSAVHGDVNSGSESDKDLSCDGKSNSSIGDGSNPDVISNRTCDLELENKVLEDSEEHEHSKDVIDNNIKDDNCQVEANNVSEVSPSSTGEENIVKETEEKVSQLSTESNIQSSVAQSVSDTGVEITEQNRADFGEFASGESEVSASISSIDNSIRTDGNTLDENKMTGSDLQKPVDKEDGVNRNCVNNDEYSAEPLDDDDDADFGEFSKADEEEDDLDFNDLREQVRNGTYGAEDSGDAPDDFGEFYEYGATHAVSDTHYDDSEEFGNFGSANVGGEETDDFGEFATVGSDDDFGDFAAPDFQGAKKGTEEGDDQDDEFGDFTSQQSSETLSESNRFSWQENPPSSTQNDSPVLRKLESLVLKWIPREPAKSRSTGSQENHFVPTLFQSVEDDAFVWRQLENLEASAALTLSWGSMQAQTLYLSSVNVDARNILFGQKWSSSVPLFAQTLSFSPLTPAKPTENSGTLDGGNRGSVTPPVMASAISPKLINTTLEGADAQIPVIDESRSEEQIPPAKFDWTSSGLINPLEGPGLEREFLSEGGEKGTSSRIKGPPAPSPLVQQILGSGMNRSPSAATPLQSLSSGAREAVENLPDISFMRSRVLMFPIRGDE